MCVLTPLVSLTHAGTAPDSKPTVDEILAQSMLYWYSGSIASSFYLYFNRRVQVNDEGKQILEGKIEQPVAVGCGQYEIVRTLLDSTAHAHSAGLHARQLSLSSRTCARTAFSAPAATSSRTNSQRYWPRTSKSTSTRPKSKERSA